MTVWLSRSIKIILTKCGGQQLTVEEIKEF